MGEVCVFGAAALGLGVAECADDRLEARGLVLHYDEAAYLEAPDSLQAGVSTCDSIP